MKKILLAAIITATLCFIVPKADAGYYCLCVGNGNLVGAACYVNGNASGSMGDFVQISSPSDKAASSYLSKDNAKKWKNGEVSKIYDASTGWLCASY